MILDPRRAGSELTALAVLGAVAGWGLVVNLVPSATVAQDVSNAGLAILALGAAAAAGRRSRLHRGQVRRTWLLLGGAVLGWGLGQLVWTWYESVLGIEVPFPSPADWGYLAFPLLAAAALTGLPLTAPTMAGRVRTVLDGLIVASSLLLCSWVVVLRPVVDAGGDALGQAISLAYPVGDIVLITLVLQTWARARAGVLAVPFSLPLVGGGMAAIAVADSGFTYMVNAGTYTTGSVIDLGWGLGFALVLLAALRRTGTGATVGTEPPVDRPVGVHLPYLAVAVAVAVSMVEVLRTGTDDVVLFWVRVVILTLLVARQVLTLRENHALARDLERRVEARTAELRASQQLLARQAFTDSLTGLPNRALFRDRLQHALRRRHDGESTLAVFFLDLDGFKAVNDTLGHSAGDELLVAVAARLRAAVRPGDTVARLGGDEFAVLLDDLAVADDALAVAGRIDLALRAPVEVQGELVHVAASTGVAYRDPEEADAEHLLRNADLAMYEAKSGSGGYVVYDPGMHRALVERVRLEADLRRALAEDQFLVEYQPLVSMQTGLMTGVEALVRWQHPDRGLVPPAEFIPLAEATGVIGDLGLWVLREACAQAVEWYRTGDRAAPLSVHVNVSPRQVRDSGLVDQVAHVLAVTALPAGCLTLELTEGVLLDDDEQALAVLADLRALGVRVAIDDFGVGYSSLSYLHRFPVDILKIDRSFVQRLAEGGDPALVTTILHLGRTLRLETVAEGIERPQEELLFQSHGCTTGQGYHFSPPVPAERIRELLAGERDLVRT